MNVEGYTKDDFDLAVLNNVLFSTRLVSPDDEGVECMISLCDAFLRCVTEGDFRDVLAETVDAFADTLVEIKRQPFVAREELINLAVKTMIDEQVKRFREIKSFDQEKIKPILDRLLEVFGIVRTESPQ